MEIVESDDYPILKFEPKAVWNHLCLAEYKMKLDLWLAGLSAKKLHGPNVHLRIVET